jgi:hypothetical protein
MSALILTGKNLLEAERYLPNADEAARESFAERQIRTRLRLSKLKSFYSTNQAEIPARFRIFRRADGSMYFIRELFCLFAILIPKTKLFIYKGLINL